MNATLQNWSGHHTFSTGQIYRPATIAELQAVVRRSRKLKVLGARHSFNDIADSTESLISLENLESALVIDPTQQTVTVNGGMTYGQIGLQLHDAGYALHNMASLPHITVAGAIATATHGSGDGNGNLATAVVALEIVTGDGDVVTLSREQNPEHFHGAVVGLGGLGVVTRVTLEIFPAYTMQQEVFENLPMAQLAEHFGEVMSAAYSVSLFTDWQKERVNQVWLKHKMAGDASAAGASDFFQATPSTAQRNPSGSEQTDRCTPQMGVPGPWYERLPHFRLDHTPSHGQELQTEYFVPRTHAVPALRAMTQLQEQMASCLRISEVRSIAADKLWMSPAYGQPCIGIHFTWEKDWPAVRRLLPVIEEQLAPFQARPHWGKLFTMSPSHLQSLYPRLPDFRDLLHTTDPAGKFRNPFLEKYIFGVS